MPKFVTSDKVRKSLADPIEFELKGQQFSIDAISGSMYAKIISANFKFAASMRGIDVNKTQEESVVVDAVRSIDYSALDDFIIALIGEDKAKEIGPVDVHESMDLMRWIIDIMTNRISGEEKNGGGQSEESQAHSQDSSDTQTSST